MSAGSPWKRERRAWIARTWIRPLYQDAPREYVVTATTRGKEVHIRVESETWQRMALGDDIPSVLRALSAGLAGEARLSAWLAELADNPPGDDASADEIAALRGEVEALTARVEDLESALRGAAALFGDAS